MTLELKVFRWLGGSIKEVAITIDPTISKPNQNYSVSDTRTSAILRA